MSFRGLNKLIPAFILPEVPFIKRGYKVGRLQLLDSLHSIFTGKLIRKSAVVLLIWRYATKHYFEAHQSNWAFIPGFIAAIDMSPPLNQGGFKN